MAIPATKSDALKERVPKTRAQDYTEKHKLNAKQISDSAFGASLEFLPKIGDYKAFLRSNSKLTVRTQEVGAFYARRGKT